MNSLRERAAAMEVTNCEARIVSAQPLDEERYDELETAFSRRAERVREALGGDVTIPGVDDTEAWRDIVGRLEEDTDTDDLADTLRTLIGRAEIRHPSLVSLQFEPEEPLDFVPGQYVRVSYGDEEPRVYSVASSPNDDAMELCIRRVPDGEVTPTLCDVAEEGETLFVRGPFGDEFTLLEPSPRDAVFVATGTGVAPLRSMLRYMFQEDLDEHDGEKRDVWLFLGSSWRDHLPYHDEFRALADEHANFHYVPTCSRENVLSDWDGETAYVQECLLKYVDDDAVADADLPERLQGPADADPVTDIDARVHPEAMEAYVCGIGVMANAVEEVAAAIGVPEKYRVVESYG